MKRMLVVAGAVVSLLVAAAAMDAIDAMRNDERAQRLNRLVDESAQKYRESVPTDVVCECVLCRDARIDCLATDGN